MSRISRKLIPLLVTMSMVISMSVSALAGSSGQEPDMFLTAAEEHDYYNGKNHIAILSPADESVYYQGQVIAYNVSSTGSFQDYTTRPFVTLEKKGTTNHVHAFTYPNDLAYGKKATFKGNIETDSFAPGIYTFGVMNWPCKDGKKLTGDEIKANKIEVPTLTVDVTIVEHKEHIWDSGKEIKPATCTEDGEKTYTCSLCGKTKTEKIPAAGHKWDKGTVTVKPDVGEKGVRTFTCKVCKEKKTEKIAALKAKIKKVPGSVKVKVKKNKATVTWAKLKNTKKNKKILKQIKSVEIQYSTSSKFPRDKRITKKVGKNKTTIVLKLKKKTKYYIRVRYVGKNGASKWSKVKKVKTK